MKRSQSKIRNRAGHTTVEMAAVILVFLLFLFGILEYCRFIFFQQIIINSAREGARFAVVNTGDNNMVADTQAQVKSFLNGFDSKVANYSCDVYMADSLGNNIGAASAATFGQYIAVDVQGDFSPILPTFLLMGKTIHLRSQTLMCSEAN